MLSDQPDSVLRTALAAACEFAARHGADPAITPAAFGIQRSARGVTTASYLDSSYAVTAIVDRHGQASFGVARLEWVHLEADEDRPACGPCGECLACRAAPCECRAGRDADGNIRLDDGRGELVASANQSRADLRLWRGLCPDDDPRAPRYDAALALFAREEARP